MHLIDSLFELGHARGADPVAAATNFSQLGFGMPTIALDHSRQLGAYLPDHCLGNHLLNNAKAVALNALLIGIHYFTPAKVAQRRPK